MVQIIFFALVFFFIACRFGSKMFIAWVDAEARVEEAALRVKLLEEQNKATALRVKEKRDSKYAVYDIERWERDKRKKVLELESGEGEIDLTEV